MSAKFPRGGGGGGVSRTFFSSKSIQLHKNNHRHNTSTNLVIDETMKYEKYGN